MPLFGPPNIDRLQARARYKRLVKALTYPRSADIRRRAIIALGELGELGQRPMPEAIEALIEKLQAQEYRRECAVALGQIGDVRAVEALVVTLNNVTPSIRAAAANALGEIRDGRAIQPLIDCLVDKDESVRQAAMDALTALGAETDEMLHAALHDDDPALRQGAVQALQARAWEPGQDTASAEYWILQAKWDEVAEVGEPAVEPLLAALSEPATMASVAKALGKIGDARAVAPLGELMAAGVDDVPDKTRQAVIQALAEIAAETQDDEALPMFLAALDDPMPEVRAAACKALGHYESAQVAPYLISQCDDPAHEVRIAALETLKPMGQPTAALTLVGALGDEQVHARSVAQDGLVAMPEASRGDITPLLTAALLDQDRNVRDRAVRVLDAYGWEPTADDAGAAYHICRRHWDDVAAIGAAAAGPLVTSLQESYVRQRALELLPATGAAAVPALIAYLDHDEPDVRGAAAQALGEIGDERALEPLLKLMALPEPETDPEDEAQLSQTEINRNARLARQRQEARTSAADALGALGAPAVPALVARLEDADTGQRALLAQALAKAGEPAIEPLIGLLADPALAPVATQSLVDAGLPAVEPLVAALSDEILREPAISVLAQLEPEPMQQLAASVSDKDADTRDALTEVASRVSDADRFALLAHALFQGGAAPNVGLLDHEAEVRGEALALLPDDDDSAAAEACRLLALADETVDAAAALTLVRRSLLAMPSFSAAWVAAAELLRTKLGEPELAIAWVMQAMALLDEDAAIGSEGEGGEVDNPHAWVELGHCQAALGDPISAASVYAAATMIDPEIADPAPWLRLIEVYRQVGRVDEMYAAIDRVRELGAHIPEDLDGGWAELVGAFDKQLLTRMLADVDAMAAETDEEAA